ncbi:hypothetical protein [Providencia phage PSTCR5]|uniref:Uncharacterized protein n=1 Tax=Providencia phage PSTCR5 TaxID=2783547 RepID=A0A873WLA7_9CAUD|nr:hypothetical protein KNV68_gp147 [Providencia phage PSTCR5]QPB12211.1 hypothetical protein [Providencia phage PSTCR5]
MRFKIVIEYRDGNSFGSYDEVDEIPYEWESIELAKKASEVILRTADRSDSMYEDYMVELELDDGTVHKFHNFWNSDYFQSLISVEIKIVDLGKVYA